MNEKEYQIAESKKRFESLAGEKIALYVHGVSAEEMISSFAELNIGCLVSTDSLAGRYVRGYYVVSLSQLLTLDIMNIILAMPLKDAEEIFSQIYALCSANDITVYNVYGMDMSLLLKKKLCKHMEYPLLWERSIEQAMDAHDVVCFDLINTVFTPCFLSEFGFYNALQKRLKEAGILIEDFTDSVTAIGAEDKYMSLREIIQRIVEDQKLTDENNKIWETICERIETLLVPRAAVMEAIEYALSKEKKVYFITDSSEYRLPPEVWEKMLGNCGITQYDAIVCSTEYKIDKEEGLYRVIAEKCAGKSCLAVGDEEEDILIPEFYGMDTFLIKSAFEIYQRLDPVAALDLENENAKLLIGKYIIDVYNDEYLLNKAENRRVEARETAIQIESKLRFYKECNAPIIYEPIIFDIPELQNDIEKYTKLNFIAHEQPQVSIIVPVYNQFGYTYNCLKSILKHSEEVTYEVIIADDCSTDQVSELEKVCTGITVLHNKDNLKFLLNCNNAAGYAKGEYILFLNNDTQVQPNWLKPLVDIMEQDKKVGLVGSKLVYPEGYLQEAGGILWKDGSAWNFGNSKDPDDPEFNYVKEADYISGAAIMVRSSLWKEIGGFDESFAPAYYEDTDLAFEVRKHGYKVIFQPKSVVVHFEGVSNGTDIGSGLKSYQVVNQKRFFEKWKNVLEKEHFENGTNVYLAKDRGQTKKQILVVDHYVPNFDKDAGGRCTFMYMKAFINMGMKVTFIGDNFAKPEPYTSILTQLGVEVLYGNFYYNNWENWLKENLEHFDYVYLQRPHISVKYIDIVKKYGSGKIFYFAHDLHHVRMHRDYLVTGNEKSLKESKYWKKIEYDLFEKADVGHVVGCYEQQVMQEAFPDKPVRNIPLYIYEEMPERIEKDFSKRQDLLFVGGFNHLPNVDAVMWFAQEIFPKVLEKYPNIVWHIVGSNAPKEVQDLASDNIILEGFVSDEELGELYRKCRMVVVPLRYGAGVKGKIVESAYYQIPVITTSIGGEGLDGSVGAFVMEDDADKMADIINGLYLDFEELNKMSNAGETLIQSYFTPKVAEEVLLSDMNLEG